MSWNVFGHEWAEEYLKHQIQCDSVRHAYLFTGPAGIGCRTLALQFAKSLICKESDEKGTPCGVCRTCLQMDRMQHADLSLVQSLDDSGKPSIGGKIKIEQIRDLQHVLSLSPYEAEYRIALLLRFQEANHNAQNALLKTLEEAPKRVILLLTAENQERLLETITSRCEIIRLRPVSVKRLCEILKNRFSLSSEEVLRIAFLSNGRPGHALKLHEHPALVEQWYEKLNDLILLLKANRRDRFSYVEDITTRRATKIERQELRESMRQMYMIWLSFWRDVLLCTADNEQLIINRDYLETIHWVAQHTGFDTARRQVEAIDHCLMQIRENLDVRLLTEVLLLDMPYLH